MVGEIGMVAFLVASAKDYSRCDDWFGYGSPRLGAGPGGDIGSGQFGKAADVCC